jgi:PAS domain S-box-containing protein
MNTLLAHYKLDTFRLLADAMPQIVWSAKPDGTLEYCNKNWYEFTGYDPQIDPNENWVSTIYAEDLERCITRWDHCMRTKEPYEIQYRFNDPRHPGSARWFIGRATPFKDAKGNVLLWIGTCNDIDELMRAQEAQRELQSKLDLALDGARIGIWDWDIAKSELSCHGRLRELYDLPEATDSIALKDILNCILPEDQARMYEAAMHAISHANPYEAEYRVKHRDGSIRWLSSKGNAHRAADGTPLRISGVVTDITERKQAELALSSSREQLALIANTVPVGIAHLDAETRFKFVNNMYAERVGLQPEDCVGKTIAEVFGEKTYTTVAPHFNQVVNSGKRHEFEVVVHYKDLGKQYMHGAYAPEFDAAGRVVGLVAAVSNVTERRLAEQTLKELEERLREAAATAAPDTVVVNHARGFRSIELPDITHLEAVQGYCLIHLLNGEKIMSSKNLSDYEKLLQGKPFQRVHRAFIVNLSHFTALDKTDGATAILSNGVTIPVSRRSVKSLSNAMKRKSNRA